MSQRPKKLVLPDQNCVLRGTKLLSQIHRGAVRRSGEIRDEKNDVLWRYAAHARPARWSRNNPLKKPDFVLFGSTDNDTTIIRRTSFVPSIFNIVEADAVIGTIRLASILRNRYSITINGAHIWTFYMPLFTVFFFGNSEAGSDFWVQMGPSEMVWNILAKPGIAPRPLAAALSFIHCERYFFT